MESFPAVSEMGPQEFRSMAPRRIIGGGYAPLRECRTFGEDLVAFASDEGSDYFCRELSTGRVVVTVATDPVKTAPVNESLEAFARSVHLFNAGYPFYSTADGADRFSEVVRSLAEGLVRIDSTAAAHNGFWEDILASVGMGDYATEFITDGLPG